MNGQSYKYHSLSIGEWNHQWKNLLFDRAQNSLQWTIKKGELSLKQNSPLLSYALHSFQKIKPKSRLKQRRQSFEEEDSNLCQWKQTQGMNMPDC